MTLSHFLSLHLSLTVQHHPPVPCPAHRHRPPCTFTLQPLEGESHTEDQRSSHAQWSETDIKDTASHHLPLPQDGSAFCTEFLAFRMEFRPTFPECCRLFARLLLPTDYAKIALLDGNTHMRNPNWDHADNHPYHNVLQQLREELIHAYQNGRPWPISFMVDSGATTLSHVTVSVFLSVATTRPRLVITTPLPG